MPALLPLLLAPAALAAPAAAQPEIAVAESWLALIDAGRWDDSWRANGALFQAQMPQAKWAAAIAPVRAPLGAARSRSLARATRTRSLPGAPDGDYVVTEFRTQFANKADAVETLVLSNEPGGWKIDGYFVR